MAEKERKTVSDEIVSFKKSRRASFAKMMRELPSMDYKVLDLREEDGFTARLAVKKAHEGAARGMLIVCAGGGFVFKSWNEALPVAELFYGKGINVSILDYHVNDAGINDEGLNVMRMAGEDGLEAIRYLRANAEEYRILPDHIAIGGFSAGGMLTGYAATRFDAGDPASSDPVKRASSRPDAALVLYGAFSRTSSVPSFPGGLTREEIAEAAKMDNVRNLRPDCPPMFVFQTHEDDPRIGLNFCIELANFGIPFEIHTFERGAHGGALYNGKDETPDEPHTALWAPVAADWLLMRGF